MTCDLEMLRLSGRFYYASTRWWAFPLRRSLSGMATLLARWARECASMRKALDEIADDAREQELQAFSARVKGDAATAREVTAELDAIVAAWPRGRVE